MSPRIIRSAAPTRMRLRCRSQQRAGRGPGPGFLPGEITPVTCAGGKAGPIMVDRDEHPRPDTTLDALAKLKPVVRGAAR